MAEAPTVPFIAPTGFREYDARWLYPKEISLDGVRTLGLALGTLVHEWAANEKIVTGHDYRSYSEDIKHAFIEGLQEAGCTIYDVGLALTPMAYFAQFELDVPAVGMVTASHNPNGWTGVKMGWNRPFTLQPQEMALLKEVVLQGRGKPRGSGRVIHVTDMRERYITDLGLGKQLQKPLRVVVACGNGTAGIFAPRVLKAIGCDVVPLHCELDYRFPNYNPNPEDLEMLRSVSQTVQEERADLGFAFDGDGDRCGVIDNEGNVIFSDKIGVLLARDICKTHPQARFVVDVKSTALFQTDPILISNDATTDYWKTGHSYIKSRTAELGAIAGFEKSGHFFFREPLGRGYDDGLLSAIFVCHMVDRAQGRPLAELYRELPVTWSSPTVSPHCSDVAKYDVVDRVRQYFVQLKTEGRLFSNRKITDLITINGVRVLLDDGSWCLVRASSNKPELVLVCESPVSFASMKMIFNAVKSLLATFPEVGGYNQEL